MWGHKQVVVYAPICFSIGGIGVITWHNLPMHLYSIMARIVITLVTTCLSYNQCCGWHEVTQVEVGYWRFRILYYYTNGII